MQKYYQKMTEIYSRLQDEESKILFEARIQFLLDKNQDTYMETIQNLYQDWYQSEELENKIAVLKPEGIIIFGCGYAGKGTDRMLSFWGHKATYFCDTYKSGEVINGKKVLSVDEVINEYRNYLVIICSYEYGKEMYDELCMKKFPRDHILFSRCGVLLGMRGKQYFDVFKPQAKEVYVDAGAFDGQTVIDFYEWSKKMGDYSKIYVFEPEKNMCRVMQQKMEENQLQRIEFINKATWDKKEILQFQESGSGSCIDNTGAITVERIDIDSIVKNEKVTYIKMDIEGSELKALEGAKNTIVNNRPRLAICIYHNPMDVIELASYILKLVPEYKFYIRQYSSHMVETVLYAEI